MPYFQFKSSATLKDEYRMGKEFVWHVLDGPTDGKSSTYNHRVGRPVAAIMKKETRNLRGIQQKMTRAGRGGIILGLVTGPLMTFLKVKDEDEYKIWDRCYRLRHNRGQVRVDQGSIVGAVGGAGIGAATGSALFGGLVGMSSGIIAMAIYNNVIVKKN
ncbi:unnamed protein product [Mytilus coruscus]|uniref:Uncharacterized protein n=1 Tax=Mytilus coruscus TaxID=42192 RepID=A0A6J8F206_MYTCO|nr:unnamed protein product [Mytilus coruscus]